MTKSGLAYEALKREILSGSYAPGAPLPLAALTRSMGFGWTPLREALSRLEADGLVTSTANRGYRATPISIAEMLDLQHARCVLETDLLITSVREGDCEWEGRIVASHYQLARLKPMTFESTSEDISEWEARHEAFHSALISGTSSKWMTRLSGQVRDHIHRHQRYILHSMISPEMSSETARAALSKATAIEHHTMLMNAALDRQEDLAVKLMGEHIAITVDVYQSLIESMPPATPKTPAGPARARKREPGSGTAGRLGSSGRKTQSRNPEGSTS